MQEENMIEKNPIKIQTVLEIKRPYEKPVLNKIQLVAEEAVLAYCKTGISTQCVPNPICSSVQRS